LTGDFRITPESVLLFGFFIAILDDSLFCNPHLFFLIRFDNTKARLIFGVRDPKPLWPDLKIGTAYNDDE
jgi:hypothetical protein